MAAHKTLRILMYNSVVRPRHIYIYIYIGQGYIYIYIYKRPSTLGLIINLISWLWEFNYSNIMIICDYDSCKTSYIITSFFFISPFLVQHRYDHVIFGYSKLSCSGTKISKNKGRSLLYILPSWREKKKFKAFK